MVSSNAAAAAATTDDGSDRRNDEVDESTSSSDAEYCGTVIDLDEAMMMDGANFSHGSNNNDGDMEEIEEVARLYAQDGLVDETGTPRQTRIEQGPAVVDGDSGPAATDQRREEENKNQDDKPSLNYDDEEEEYVTRRYGSKDVGVGAAGTTDTMLGLSTGASMAALRWLSTTGFLSGNNDDIVDEDDVAAAIIMGTAHTGGQTGGGAAAAATTTTTAATTTQP
jgi:hypothetical protein